MLTQRYYIQDGKCVTSYICVKSHNLSSVVVVLCHIGPTLSSLVAGNALVMHDQHLFRMKIYMQQNNLMTNEMKLLESAKD